MDIDAIYLWKKHKNILSKKKKKKHKNSNVYDWHMTSITLSFEKVPKI